MGDEPRDIVFARPGRKREFITMAQRGQNIPFNPQFTTPGVGRVDVWMFDADELSRTRKPSTTATGSRMLSASQGDL